jgi:SAM-dependent methyltransferase
MDATLERVRDDFDRIARVSPESGDHGGPHEAFLLAQLPARCARALEVGCGTGSFARVLAARADRVLGIDLSPEMIRIARERCAGIPHLELRLGDVMEADLPPGGFDVIVSIATLHHLPLEPVIRRLSAALAPGGTLVVLDLFTPATPADWFIQALSYPLVVAHRRRRIGRLRQPREVREVWEAHGRNDRYPTLAEVRRVARDHLPGARVDRRLMWRYSLVWRKP